jgi:S1-C subfamily serine protease
MGRLIWCAVMLWSVACATMSQAQESWIQIEAQPSLAEAEARARAYAGVFPNVAGFALGSGWYGIMVGPFTPQEAVRQLDLLTGERLIPRDSYIPEGGRLGQRFWPVGAGAVTLTPVTPDTPIAAPQVIAEPGTASEPELPPVLAPILTPVLPDESPREARASEAALTDTERELIQTALQWEGFYVGKIDGSFGAGTRKSMGAWQGAQGLEETGILTTAQRAALLNTYQADVAEIGLQTVNEAEAGVEITLPMKLVTFGRYQPPFVQYDAAGNSGFQVLLISQQGDESTLFGLYDIMQTLEIVPLTGDRERKAAAFVLKGANAKVQSYTQAELRGGFIKGFTLVWNPSDSARAEKVLAAMKSSFKAVGDRALDDSLGQPLAESRADLMAGLEIRHPAISRSGFFIDGTGLVATTTEVLAGCARITIDNAYDADIVLQDAALGVAVLRPRAPLSPRATAEFQADRPRLNAEVAVGGYSYEDTLDAPVTTFGTLADLKGLDGEESLTRLDLTALPGDAGGPVLDSSGSVVGMLLPKAPREATGGKVLPADVSFALDASIIATLLTSRGMMPVPSVRSGAMAAEDLSKLATGMTVLVSCWD